MSKINLYQVYDKEAETIHGPILAAPRHAAAARAFRELLKTNDTLPAQHPNDFELRWIGVQDVETGAIEPTGAKPPVVITGTQLVDDANAKEMREKAAQEAPLSLTGT